LLFLYSEDSIGSLRIEQAMLYKVILIYATGYCVVFIKWLAVIKSDEPYLGKADDVPSYLTDKLWGAFPYLGTLGNSNQHNLGQSNLIVHTYQDCDVSGKKFREIFVLHTSKYVILFLVLTCIFLPYIFLNQAAPSFLKFIFSSTTLFTIYLSFFIITWLSSIAILVLRIIISSKHKISI